MIKSRKILVISRSPWHEPPRMRHQLSRLLRDCGVTIYYLQTLGFGKIPDKNGEEGIHCLHIWEPVHHQLRPFRWISIINAFFVKRQIQKVVENISPDIVLNFNYDYDFLLDLLPQSIFITVINDDFVAMAKPWMRKSIANSLEMTCRISDRVITVSYFLETKLKPYNKHIDLLLPWSEKKYTKPKANLRRNVVLYYGYVSRLDEEIVDGLVNEGIKLRFIGPIEGNGHRIKEKYNQKENVEFLPAESIDNIYLNDVCCSIAPYDMKIAAINATTASNRLFRLLACGIPMAFPNMEYLIKAPETIIRKCRDVKEFIIAIDFFKHNFDDIQEAISEFMEHHTVSERREQVCSSILETS